MMSNPAMSPFLPAHFVQIATADFTLDYRLNYCLN